MNDDGHSRCGIEPGRSETCLDIPFVQSTTLTSSSLSTSHASAPRPRAVGDQTRSCVNPNAASSVSSSVLSTARTTVSAGTATRRDGNSPQPTSSRRPSSVMSLNGTQSASSSKLSRKSSRASLNSLAESTERKLTPKRSISNLIAGLREAQASMGTIEEPIAQTAAEIANIHFQRELAGHETSSIDADTVVVLHDACYGHRWSRLRTSKSSLAMIVERPERIKASVLGIALAYVRLGQHHAGASFAPQPQLTRASTSPPFAIHRSNRSLAITDKCVTNVHGTSWMSELRELCNLTNERLAAGVLELKRTPNPDGKEKPQLHEGDLYLSSDSLAAFEGALGGVADAVDAVYSTATSIKRAFVAIRPPGHHCSSDLPSGFCWLNNVHVGIEYAAQRYGLTHAVILDFDLHHGDGSQTIAWARNQQNQERRLSAKPNSKLKLNPEIGYYSLHDINSYPCESGEATKVQSASLCIDNAHGQSIWNIHLQAWKSEDEFWELYKSSYKALIERAQGFLERHTSRIVVEGKGIPKAAIFVSAGFDASEWEGSGMQRHNVNVPTEFYARFTNDVVRMANIPGTGCDGRVISVLEGGYSDLALCSGILSHLSGLCARSAGVMYQKEEALASPEAQNLMAEDQTREEMLKIQRTWWSAANLAALENVVSPAAPNTGKKIRVGSQPTYATPTESFAYKVIDPNKFAQSVSGTLRDAKVSHPHTPPPPEVDWITASKELSKLLIPQDRTTSSCSADELAAPRVKKEKAHVFELSVESVPHQINSRQLRERMKSKQSEFEVGGSRQDTLEVSRTAGRSSNRRKTMHELPLTGRSDDALEPLRPRRESRRLSAMHQTLSSEETMLAAHMQDKSSHSPTLPLRTTASSAVKGTENSLLTAEALRDAVADDFDGLGLQENIKIRPDGSSKQPVQTDVDALTSGMKRITLKVGTREEHDRKQKEREAADRRSRALKAAETRKANAIAKKMTAAPRTISSASARPSSSTSAVNSARSTSSVEPSVLKPLRDDLSRPRRTDPSQLHAENTQVKTVSMRAENADSKMQPDHRAAPCEPDSAHAATDIDSRSPGSNQKRDHEPRLKANSPHPPDTSYASATSAMSGIPVPQIDQRTTLPHWTSSGYIPFASNQSKSTINEERLKADQ